MAVKKGSKTNRTLVMLSGGMDSTAALWLVLNDPEKYGEVHVHHVHIQNMEGRWKAEAQAVEAIYEYMREHAPTKFTTSDSTIRTPHFGNKFMYDVEVVSYLSGYMTSRDPKIKRVVVGVTASDFESGITDSVSRAKRSHNAFHPEEKDHSGRIKEYPQKDMTKEEVYKSMPPELAALTWSCRTPRYADGKPLECGRCKTCKTMKNIQRPKSAGKRVST